MTTTPILPEGTLVPLIFTYRDLVAGQGFVARVEMRGRALARYDDGGVWIDGISPDNLSAGGPNLDAAHSGFRREFTSVLYDLANEHGRSIEEFRGAVVRMFSQTNPLSQQEWLRGVATARERHLRDQLNIETLDPDTETFLRVDLIENAMPVRDNVLEPEPALAA